ncbi:hypothetical protein PIB30_086815, partial [Stylosanthes scabra]|nr:hypothetical protein [Stylosanthes scabra]
MEMLSEGSWVRKGEKIKVEFLPCLPNNRVCERREDVAYHYVYVGVVADLKMKFLFTKIECQVLTQMSSALSQLHLNSWAFIRAFEVLMEFLECQPSLGLFFSLFQVRSCWKGTYVNLNSFLGRSVFALFRTSYKSFQDMFIKVRSILEEFPFYVDEYLCPKFPLYWSCKPIQILDVKNRTEFKELVLEFLTSTEVMEEVLSCAELIKWEEDSQSVREYLGEKAPDLNSTSMKAFLRQRASRKEVSVSEVCKGIGGEGGYTSSRVRYISIKRKKVEGVTMVADKGSEDLSSLWGEDYPFTALAEDYGQSPADVKLVTEAGNGSSNDVYGEDLRENAVEN